MAILRVVYLTTMLAAIFCFASFMRQSSKTKDRGLSLLDHGLLDKSLRVAVFGTGNAYGAKLENRFMAYPYLLTTSVDNYAHFGAQNLNYYSTCTETAVGDDKIYDVIILDYYVRFEQGLGHLTRKLRVRYPNAIIIIINLWHPAQFRRRGARHNLSTFNQWRTAMGFDQKTPFAVVRQALENDGGEWYLPERKLADETVQNITRDMSAIRFDLPKDPAGEKQTLLNYLGLYESQTYAKLNEVGHDAVANMINQQIQSVSPNVQEHLRAHTPGTWGKGDFCNLWYSTGGTHLLYSKQTFTMTQIDADEGTYALQANQAGWIDVENPFENYRTLYLSFLTSQTPDFYPKVEIRYPNTTIAVDPINTEKRKHKTKTVKIGPVKPGTTRVIVLPALAPSVEPFSLVGVSLTDEDAEPLTYGFGPTYELEDVSDESMEEEEEEVVEETA